MELNNLIRNIIDFPVKGIVFRDITTLLKDANGLKSSIDLISNELTDVDFDIIVGPESRGFIFGVPLAYKLNKGFVPVRKPGKLPAETISKTYDLEYGCNSVEIHVDAIQKGQKVVIIDDLLATGGTTKATIELIKQLGGCVVKVVYLIELCELDGREALKEYNIASIIKY